ncbi:MAG: hypothetical protein GF405_02525 [Candidatus Eisenbacteria bacterium]|nr:hypothetical protein [Candidatus Eisenbacteria bacterium]
MSAARTALVCLAACSVVCCTAAAHPVVMIDPPELAMAPGETLSVSVRVADVDTISCYMVELSFDAATIQLVSAAEGTLFATSGHSTMFDWDQLADGLHSVNDVLLGPWSYVLAPGELARLSIGGVCPGTCWLEITAVDLRDIRRDPILPVETSGCCVQVETTSSVPGSFPNAGPRLSALPNPTTAGTRLALQQPASASMTAVLYDVRGRRVRELVIPAGSTGAAWDLTDRFGRTVPCGVYFVGLEGRITGTKITVLH